MSETNLSGPSIPTSEGIPLAMFAPPPIDLPEHFLEELILPEE